MKRKDDFQRAMEAFEKELKEEEKSKGTIENYLREAASFLGWVEVKTKSRTCENLTKSLVTQWKKDIAASGYKTTTVNAKICAVNHFLKSIGLQKYKVKTLQIQKQMFRSSSRELSRAEYEKLLMTAEKSGKEDIRLIIETICGTGIRVSEIRYITVEAVRTGRAEISLKGKNRIILLPHKLCKKLLKFAQSQRIKYGEIFLSERGKSISRKWIWTEMKKLAEAAGIEKGKVFPHNLRHLFAKIYYKINHDLIGLAAMLGHSSIETTRCYLISSEASQLLHLSKMKLIS